MTREREIQAALGRGCSLSEVLRMAKPQFSYAARSCADDLEDYLRRQHGEQEWTPAAKVEVIKIVDRHFRGRP